MPCLLGLGVAAGAGFGQVPGAAPPRSDLIDAPRLIDDLRTLSSDAMAGRRTGTDGAAAARAFLVQRFSDVKLQPVGESFEVPFQRPSTGSTGLRGVNIVGRVAGRTNPDRHVVVSAHYDHIGIKGGQVFNGANDNASGAAALSVIAEYFVRHRPAVSLLFVAFDAEEADLAGSRAFVRSPPVPLASIVANINLDMIGRDASETLWIAGVHRFPVFEPFVMNTAASAPIRIRLGHDDPSGRNGEDWTRDSDHYAFIEAGIPALYIGVEDYKFLHSADDDFATMMPEFYAAAVDAIVNVIEGVDAGAEAIARVRSQVR
jgi:Zn-dependent M28 family amino/carboxypeptidase